MTRVVPCAALLLAACAPSRSHPGAAPVPRGGVAGRPIAAGETRAGALTLGSPRFSDSSRYELFVFTARGGDTLTATLVSDDFDPYLIFADAHGNTLAKDDDGAGDCNARLVLAPAAAGPYRLYVNSSARAELGEFRLTLTPGVAAAPADSECRGFGRVAGMIRPGETVTDSLTARDLLFTTDSTYFQRWILPARAGRTLTVDLSSAAFDAYLMLAHGRGRWLATDDDGGPGCDARIVYTPADDRPLRVIVNTASRPRRQTGPFTLRVTEGAAPVDSSHDCQGRADPTRVVRVGQPLEGRLTSSDLMFNSDSTYAQIWTLEGVAGDSVTIDLASDDFDAFLIVSGPGLAKDLQNDDGGGGCNARVTLAFPRTGSYQVVVNSADKLATGRFRLAVRAGAAPPPAAGDPQCDRAPDR